MFRVLAASAAASTDGLGKSAPKELKCRSGSHRAWKPCSSAYFDASMISAYLSLSPSSG